MSVEAFSSDHEQAAFRTTESIRDRQEIQAPPGFVSVYHEIVDSADRTEQIIDSISLFGLEPGHTDDEPNAWTERLIGRHRLVDAERPDWVAELGITRECSYAYPSLEYGNGIGYGRSRQILEVKVNPGQCYVADMEYFSRFTELSDRGLSDEEAAKEVGRYYWGSLVRLDDFLAFYELRGYEPDDEPDGFYIRSGAPAGLSEFYYRPEILISQPIPPQHIRVLH